MICINNLCYEIVDESRDGFNEEAFRARYSEILTKYDYIVGDWGYGQLRLRGFFDDQTRSQLSIQKSVPSASTYMSIAILAVLILSPRRSRNKARINKEEMLQS